MADSERRDRELQFRQDIERSLPNFAQMCDAEQQVILLHQDAFAADYQDAEFALLGRAIKYAGLSGKEIHITGRNGETLRPKAA